MIGPSASGPGPRGDTLRIVVYNIHHGEGTDGVLDLERIASLIRARDPDVVALQEVDSVAARTGGVDQAAELGRLTGLQPHFGRFMAYQGGAYGMAVLTRWPAVSVRNVRLPDGAEEPRSSVVVTLRSPATGRTLTFAGVHFYRTEDDRMAQARALSDTLRGSAPAIMAGDFNSTPDSEVMEMLSDCWTALDKGDDRLTYPSAGAEREIDYVLVRPDPAFAVIRHDVLDEPVASDHRPLVAELVWH